MHPHQHAHAAANASNGAYAHQNNFAPPAAYEQYSVPQAPPQTQTQPQPQPTNTLNPTAAPFTGGGTHAAQNAPAAPPAQTHPAQTHGQPQPQARPQAQAPVSPPPALQAPEADTPPIVEFVLKCDGTNMVLGTLQIRINATIEMLQVQLVPLLQTKSVFRLRLDDKDLKATDTVEEAGFTHGCSVYVVFAYTMQQKLGSGTFASVYKAFNNFTKETVAMKRSQSEYVDEGIPSSTLREISALKELNHENIIPVKDVLVEGRFFNIVLEHADCELSHYLQNNTITPTLLNSFVFQLLSGVKYGHDRRVIHRDLKPQNILIIKKSLTLKIADYGLARAFQYPMEHCTPETVTLWYRSPELLLGLRNYTPLVDIWSVGAMMGEMSLGRPLFGGDCEVDCLFKIFRLCGTPTNAVWDGVETLPFFRREFPKWRRGDFQQCFPKMEALSVDLLENLLQPSPEDRYTADEALAHPCFNVHKRGLHISQHGYVVPPVPDLVNVP